MMISYYIAAVFVTIYYLMLLPKLFEACGRPMWISKGNNIYTRFVTGFEESVVGFLDALLFFAISMNVAAITRYASALQNPNESVSVYSLQDCVFLSAFSIFPAVVLQSLSVEVRRRRIRLFLWFLVMFFAVVLEVLYQGTYINTIYTEDLALKYVATPQGFVQYVWLSNCQSIPLWDQLTNLLTVGHVIMLFNSPWWLYFLLASVGAKRWTPFFQKRQRFWKIWSAVRFWLRVGNGLLCLIVMWVFLSLFTAYRSDIASKAGAADQDDEWTFGQVLSLVTWVPVGIDLVAIYICKFIPVIRALFNSFVKIPVLNRWLTVYSFFFNCRWRKRRTHREDVHKVPGRRKYGKCELGSDPEPGGLQHVRRRRQASRYAECCTSGTNTGSQRSTSIAKRMDSFLGAGGVHVYAPVYY